MFLENKYSKWYWELMASRQKLQRDGYLERHHITPKSLGGSNARSNIVALTAREHFIAHLLLVRMLRHPEKRKMQFALMFLMGRGRGKGRQLYVPSSKIYEIYRKECAASNMGRTWTEAQRQKMSAKMQGRVLTAEHCAKIGDRHRGKVLSDATKAKLSAAKTGVKLNLSDEQRQHRRALVTGVKQPPRDDQWRERQREAQKKKVMSDEARAKISAGVSGTNNPRAKIWLLERKDGSIFEVKALKPWCRGRGLSFDAICRRDGRWFDGVRLFDGSKHGPHILPRQRPSRTRE